MRATHAAFHVRIARPVGDLARAVDMYCRGLGLLVIDRFEDHDGFDGVMLAQPGADHHFEFTVSRTHPVAPAPTREDLLVVYIPSVADWDTACAKMLAAGFVPAASFNPYWDVRGRTFQDPDGYRTVLQCDEWNVKPLPHAGRAASRGKVTAVR